MRFSSVFRLLCLGLAILLGRSAAAEDSLLIVVEASGASVAADDVRAAVAKEIRGAVAAPLGNRVDTDGDMLLVAVDAHRAVLSFRPRQGPARQRIIDLPDGREEQLKTLGWIAMNLVTNQVDELGGKQLASEVTSATAPSVTDTLIPPPQEKAAALKPPPPQTSASEAAPFEQTPVPATKVQAPVRTGWSVSAFLGPRMAFFGPGYPESGLPWKWTWSPNRRGQEFDVEIQRNYADWQLGAALDIGQGDQPAFALAAFAGDGWQWRKVRLDATLGLGIELVDRQVAHTEVTDSSTAGISTQDTITNDLRPRIYGRGNLTLAWQARPAVALLFRLGLHLSPESVLYCYGGAFLGLRVNLP